MSVTIPGRTKRFLTVRVWMFMGVSETGVCIYDSFLSFGSFFGIVFHAQGDSPTHTGNTQSRHEGFDKHKKFSGMGEGLGGGRAPFPKGPFPLPISPRPYSIPSKRAALP